MADIRRTPVIDDFERADEFPLASPWLLADNSWGTGNLDTGNYQGSPGDSVYYYSTLGPFDDDMEVWGAGGAGIDDTEAWRLALLKDVGGTNAVDGYLLLIVASGGGANWQIRKYTNWSGVSTLASVSGSLIDAGGGSPEYALLRINGDDIEAWYCSDVTSWTLVASATDTTYRTDLYLSMGISTDDGGNPSWQAIGGGAIPPWVPEFIRRPWEHHGGHLTL